MQYQKMQYQKIFYTLLLCCVLSVSFSQQDFSGLWTGVITQEDSGQSTEFKFELYLKQTGDKVTGRSYVSADGIHAEMELSGTIYSGFYLHFQESKIVQSEVHEGMEWCIKNGHLVFKKEGAVYKLEGAWRGTTSFNACTPGKVRLKKKIPRA